MDQRVLDFYATPGALTAVNTDLFTSSDIRDVVDMVQGLLVYDVVAEPFYGVQLGEAQADTIHERDSAKLLEFIRAVDDRPLHEARPPEHRVGARCHTFSRLTVAFLRAAGVPARARCGFAAYFNPGWFEDHWVAEYWNAADLRWQMVDAQLDATWRRTIAFDRDPCSITDDDFLTAGHAWQAWRSGDLDAGRCGLSAIDEHGTHWIAGNLRLDLAALTKVEMLPWDVWGEGWEPGAEPTHDQLRLFDEVAEMTVGPDTRFDDLRSRYGSDDRVRMDGTVFNVLRQQIETVPRAD
jgi:hypothetical protein